MAHPSQNPDQPRHIAIRLHPFESSVAATLVNALDHEIGIELYPEVDDANHPQSQHAPDGGFNPNPKPKAATDSDGRVDATGTSADSTDGRDENEQHGLFDDLTIQQVDDLHFHVAFDVTDMTTTVSEAQAGQGEIIRDAATKGEPVGCVGLRLMPYFPHHEAQPTPPSSPSAPATSSHPRYAEIKRFYVAKSHRSVSITLDDQSSRQQQRVASSLLTATVKYAREVLHVDVLVLEVGFRQMAAIKLYERLGWRRRDVFGVYVGEGVESGGVSMCYELDLRDVV